MSDSTLESKIEKMCKAEAMGGLMNEWSESQPWDEVYDAVMSASDFPSELTLTQELEGIDFSEYQEKLKDEFLDQLAFAEKVEDMVREKLDSDKISEKETQEIYDNSEGENEYEFIVSETVSKTVAVRANSEEEAYEAVKAHDQDSGFTYGSSSHVYESCSIDFNGEKEQTKGLGR